MTAAPAPPLAMADPVHLVTPDTERRQLYNRDSPWPPSSCYSSQACDSGDPGHEARARHPSDNRRYGRSKAAMSADAKAAARKAQSHSSDRDCAGWDRPTLKAAMSPDAKAAARKAQSHSSDRDCAGWDRPTLKHNQRYSVRETKNLCYSATYQKNKRKNCNI